MSDPRCKCTMSQSAVGDGCRYCQPQEYIDRLEEWLDDERQEMDKRQADLDRALARVAELEKAGAKAALHWSDAQRGYQSDELMEFRGVIEESTGSFILRKQAEAVELMCAEWEEESRWIINESHANYQRHYAKAGRQYATRLRQQADELERQQ